MFAGKLNTIVWLARQIFLVFKLTFSRSFWSTIRKNRKYWGALLLKGYVTIQTQYPNGSPAIQTVFFLFGDITNHIHAPVLNNKPEGFMASHLRHLERFKIGTIYFIPVVINAITWLAIVIYNSIKLIKTVNL